jgi:hypothetical protein
MRRLPIALLFGFLLPAAAAAVELPADLRETLEKGERFELLSIRPARVERAEGAFNFHGWEVIGRTWVRDPALRKKIVAAFRAGVEENQGLGASCFRPRHGIRVTQKGRVTDFIVCFECYRTQVYVDDRPQKSVLVTRSPEGVFNESLKEAKLPLSDQ